MQDIAVHGSLMACSLMENIAAVLTVRSMPLPGIAAARTSTWVIIRRDLAGATVNMLRAVITGGLIIGRVDITPARRTGAAAGIHAAMRIPDRDMAGIMRMMAIADRRAASGIIRADLVGAADITGTVRITATAAACTLSQAIAAVRSPGSIGCQAAMNGAVRMGLAPASVFHTPGRNVVRRCSLAKAPGLAVR